MVRILFSLLFVFLLAGCETNTSIVNNVSERDANEILLLLGSRGIQAQKTLAPATTVGGGTGQQMWDIMVPSAQLNEAIGIMNQAGLPRPKGTSLLDLFGQPGIVPSDLQDRIRYQEGLSEQLAMTIRKMDGVLDADVQITFPRDEEEAKKPLTASVYIKYRGILDASNNLLITKIKRLVSSAIPGLTLDNVTVVADRALLADASLTSHTPHEGRDLVSIWSVVVTKDSAAKFRVIFYTFLILVFVLALLLLYVIWKFYPIIVDRGWRTLLEPKQVTVTSYIEPPPEVERM